MSNTHNIHSPSGGSLLPPREWPPAGPAPRVAAALADVVRLGEWGANSPVTISAREEFGRLQSGETDVPAYAVFGTNRAHMVQLMLRAAHIGKGDEVIIPMMAPPVIRDACEAVNAVPVMAGILPGTYCLDPDQVKRAISSRTKAIFAAHQYGSMADMNRLRSVAAGAELALFEECTDAVGAQWDGIGAGMIGDGGTFSFHSDQNLPAGLAGGAITKWPWLANRLDMARNGERPPGHPRYDGKDRPDWWWLGERDESALELPCGSSGIDGFQAAALGVMCQCFPELNKDRLAGRSELDYAVGEIRSGGVQVFRPMGSQPHVTVPPTNVYVLRYDEAAWGIPASVLRQVLSVKFGRLVRLAYEPLSDSDPVANRAYRDALVFDHTLPLPGVLGPFVECCKWIEANRTRLIHRYTR